MIVVGAPCRNHAAGIPHEIAPAIQSALEHSPLDPARGSILAALGFAQFTVRNYQAAAEAAELALAEATESATPLILASIARVGTGQIDKAQAAFERVAAIAPSLVEARLSGRWLSTNPDYVARADLFFRIAAGLETADTAEMLR